MIISTSTVRSRYTVEPGLQLIDPTSAGGVQPNGLTGWTLQFSDEFNGSTLDRLKWDTLYPNWSNFTSQVPGGNRTNTDNDNYYNDNNATLDGASNLDLVMQPDTTTFPGLNYKSGMVQSLKSYTVAPGSFTEVRLRLSGLYDIQWPAAWMSNAAVATWPPEIDFFEHYGQGGGYLANTYLTAGTNDIFQVTGPADVTAFHTYGVRWNAGSTLFYLDGTLVRTANLSLPGTQYLILNMAARKTQPAPGANPHMYVDYIRAWR